MTDTTTGKGGREKAKTNGSGRQASDDSSDRAREKSATRIAAMRHDPEAIRRAFETGEYPYKSKMRRSTYETHKQEL